tara:strand:+ start:494 stop:715 length:222 start_codon:yes stop_codon:yes gene_type:complete
MQLQGVEHAIAYPVEGVPDCFAVSVDTTCHQTISATVCNLGDLGQLCRAIEVFVQGAIQDGPLGIEVRAIREE